MRATTLMMVSILILGLSITFFDFPYITAQTVTPLGSEPILLEQYKQAVKYLQDQIYLMFFGGIGIGVGVGIGISYMIVGAFGFKTGIATKMNRILVIELFKNGLGNLRMIKAHKGWNLDKDNIDYISPDQVFKFKKLFFLVKYSIRPDGINPQGLAYIQQYMREQSLGNVKELLMQIKLEYLKQIFLHRADPQREKDFVQLYQDVEKDVARELGAAWTYDKGGQMVFETDDPDKVRNLTDEIWKQLDEIIRSVKLTEDISDGKSKKFNILMSEGKKKLKEELLIRGFTPQEIEIIFNRANDLRDRLKDMVLDDTSDFTRSAVQWWATMQQGRVVREEKVSGAALMSTLETPITEDIMYGLLVRQERYLKEKMGYLQTLEGGSAKKKNKMILFFIIIGVVIMLAVIAVPMFLPSLGQLGK